MIITERERERESEQDRARESMRARQTNGGFCWSSRINTRQNERLAHTPRAKMYWRHQRKDGKKGLFTNEKWKNKKV